MKLAKFQLTFKTPDVLENLVQDEEKQKELEVALRKWITYGEYITVEYDDEKDTLEVKKN
jgi:hypothetical protein